MAPCRRLLAALVAALLVVPPAAATAQDSVPRLPDLVSRAATDVGVEDYDFGAGAGGVRRLLRFDGYIENSASGGRLELSGSTNVDGAMTSVVQRVWSPDRSVSTTRPTSATFVFADNDGHFHWHLGDAARYSLVSADGTTELGVSQKVGFCMVDSGFAPNPFRTSEYGYETNGDCGKNDPGREAITMGLTPGWWDFYGRNLWFQWVDVSGVQPGTYRLRSQVDPDDRVDELNEVNPPADVTATVPGRVATPVARTGLPRSAPVEVTLTSDAFAASAPAQYRIVSAPAHGTLDVPLNTWVTSDRVTYTPADGEGRADGFEFEAREGTSRFPTSPARASVALSFATPAPPPEQVAISGAPSSLQTGATAQLTATVLNSTGDGVAWSVDGVAGGDATRGTVDPDGTFHAPGSVPAGETVTVRATGAGGAYDEATIRITAPPPRDPAPGGGDPDPGPGDPDPGPGDPGSGGTGDPGTGGTGDSGSGGTGGTGNGGTADPGNGGTGDPGSGGSGSGNAGDTGSGGTGGSGDPNSGGWGDRGGSGDPGAHTRTGGDRTATTRRAAGLSHLRVRRAAPFVVASVTPRRSGRLRVTFLAGTRPVGTCRIAAVARRPFSCRLRPTAARLRTRLRVVATLHDTRDRTTQRRATLPAVTSRARAAASLVCRLAS